jgi:hypothetical protein
MGGPADRHDRSPEKRFAGQWRRWCVQARTTKGVGGSKEERDDSETNGSESEIDGLYGERQADGGASGKKHREGPDVARKRSSDAHRSIEGRLTSGISGERSESAACRG